MPQNQIEEMAITNKGIEKDKNKKVIYIPNKIINFIVM